MSDFTVGVEEEYQLVDTREGALRSRASAVLATDWTGDIKPEMQLNTIEIGTRACASAGELRVELERLRLEASIAAESQGLRIVAAGTHPFSEWGGHDYSPGEVYEHLRDTYRHLADTQSIFGMHVHVAVPEGVDRVRVMNVARCYSAYLLALSASSPLFLGEDTGYASYRAVMWRRWPRSGPPPRFEGNDEFQLLVETLTGTACIDAPGRIYWEIRPHHLYPTLEFRAPDVTPRLEDAVAVAALARAVVMGAVEGVLREPDLPDSVIHPLLVENAWRAARYGVEAELVDLSDGPPRSVPAREVVGSLMERLEPLARRAGDDGGYPELLALLERGEAARRVRERPRESDGERAELVRWLADETMLGLGLDRRTEQRDD